MQSNTLNIVRMNLYSRILLGAAIVCGQSVLAQGNIVPNGSFEINSTVQNSVIQNWSVSPFGTSKTTGKNGGAALRLNNNAQTVLTSFAKQSADNAEFGNGSAFVYTSKPDSVRITFKAQLNGDTAQILIGLNAAGDNIPISLALFQTVDNSGAWKTISIPFTHSSIDPVDSGWVEILSHVGSNLQTGFIEIDNIELVKASSTITSIPNSDFETWQNQTEAKANNWFLSDNFHSILGKETGTSTIIGDAKSGNSALQLKSKITAKGDTLSAFAILSNKGIESTPELPVFPVSGRFESFRIWIKGNYLNRDRTQVLCNFFKNGEIVGQAMIIDSANSTAYKLLAANIDWDNGFTGTPDSAAVSIALTGSVDSIVSQTNTVVVVDDLHFSFYANELKHPANTNLISMFPNPAKNFLQVRSTEIIENIIFSDLQGREVLKVGAVQENTVQIALNKLKKGFYFVQITTQNSQKTEKILIEP